jgi:CHAT domain-containing protein/tetratricopeptide (TPR) repeat protein
LRSLVEPLFTTAKYDSVLSLLPGYIRRAEATHDSVLLGRALTQRGRVMLVLGRFDEAGRDLDSGIHIAESVRDTIGLMPALHFKAYVYTAALRYGDAKRCFERRLLLAQRKRSPVDEAWARSGMAYILLQTGEPQAAKTEYERSIALFRASGLTRLEITSLIGLGRVEGALGDIPAAIRCYQRAWVASREVGDRMNEMWAMNNLGHHELGRGNLDRAVQYQRRAFELARELKSPQAMVVPATNLAQHAEALGDFESAEATLNEVGALCDSLGATDLRPMVDVGFAHLRISQGRNHAALVVLRRLESNLDAVDPQHRDFVVISLAQQLAASDSVPAAIQVLTDYLKRGGTAYGEESARVNLAVAHFRADLGDTRGALEYTMRARAMAEHTGQRPTAVAAAFFQSSCLRKLGEKGAAVTTFYAALDSMEALRGGIATADWREVYGQEIARDVVDAGVVLREEPASATRSERDASFFDAMQRVKTRTLLDRISAPRAGSASGMGPRREPVCTLRALQAALLPGEMMLDFHVGSRRSFMAAVTPDSLRVLELPGPGSPLSDTIRLFNRVVGSDNAAERAEFPTERLTAVQTALGHEILPGVADLVTKSSRVFVSADGFYAAVPFGLVIMQEGGRVLIADHDVVQTPSASVLVRERTMDPVRRVTDPAIVAIRAHESRLSGARDEVRDLERHYSGVRVMDGVADATAFQEAALHCDVLHISSHALVVDRSPWLSGVRLATAPAVPVDSTTPSLPTQSSSTVLSATDSLLIERTFHPDPYLRAWQIAPLQLSTRLAVLSACETAGGRTTTGEGTLGLTAAFLSAGVPVVVASMWPVEDRVTARVMRAFYHNLAAGKPVATALRLAQLEVSRDRRHAHPFYWAGFTVVGDGSMMVAMKEQSRWHAPAILAGAALLLVVVALVSISRRRRATVR